MTKMIYPDELVTIITQEIAYNKGSITVDKLWDIVGKYIELTDESIKKYAFECLKDSSDIEFYHDNNLSQKNEVLFDNKLKEFELRIAEDKLWQILTGYNKKECKIGAAAFELLLEIANSKTVGINTKELAEVAKQDRRSVSGRIKKIEHLVKSTQIVYKGHIVKLIKLNKFASDAEKKDEYVSVRDNVATIVSIVKNSKNRIRQIIDLRRELKYDQNNKMSKSFLSAISWLQDRGCLRKVYVVSPSDPSRKIRCVQYIKDLDLDDKTSEDYESDSDDEDMNNEEKPSDEAFEELDNLNSTHLLQEDGLILTDADNNTKKNDFLLNRFYPIQNQTYDFAKKFGTEGVSMMDAIQHIVGRDYKRAFTRSSELYIDTVGKQTNSDCNDAIVRVYDFEGKKKFYRLFTKDNFQKLAGATDPVKSFSFPPLDTNNDNLIDVNVRESRPIVDSLRFTELDGEDKFFWHGTLDVPKKVATHPSKSGRKRKISKELDTQLVETKKTQKQKENTPSTVESKEENETLVVDTFLSDETNKKPTNIFNVGGFTAGSLRSLKRQQAILSVVTNTGGIASIGDRFLDAVSKKLGSMTIVDKKTLRGDIELMISSQKLNIQYDNISKKQYIFLPSISKEQFSDHLVKEKDNKKIYYSKDTLHDTDIYFFDQTEKNRFHRGLKSVERVKKFQDKTKKKSTAVTIPTETKNLAKPKRKANKNASTTISVNESDVSKSKASSKLITQYHLGKKSGLRALIFSIVITKSIKNEILWDEITKLFPSNSLQNLKKQWTTCRVRMGYHGWKAYIDKWKRILVSAIKNETILLKDVEELALPKLIKLWIDYENKENNKHISLYKCYSQNKKNYSFVSNNNNNNESYISLAMSSMVQREVFLLKKVYTTELSNGTIESRNLQSSSENELKSIIRSILMEVSETSKDKMNVLDGFRKEEIDKVVMDMAKEKQLYLRGSKLEASSTVDDILNSKSNVDLFEESALYKSKLEEMLGARTGVVLSKEINDYSATILIDLMSREKISLDVIPLGRRFEKLNYSTRTLDNTYLTPPLIISPKYENMKNVWKINKVAIPRGKAFTRLWLNAKGNVREDVWKKVVSMVLGEILFNPGIVVSKLMNNCSKILYEKEIIDICDWLKKKKLIYDTPFNGFSASHDWYTFLSK